MMPLNAHDRAEFARCAAALRKRGDEAQLWAAKLEAAAAVSEMDVRAFDEAKDVYRAWLVFDEPRYGDWRDHREKKPACW